MHPTQKQAPSRGVAEAMSAAAGNHNFEADVEQDGLLHALFVHAQFDAARVQRLDQAAGPERAELSAEIMRRAARFLLTRHLPEMGDEAAGAYDVGLASGFYGQASAIAEGVRAECGGQCARSEDGLGMLEAVRAFGEQHGGELLGWVTRVE